MPGRPRLSTALQAVLLFAAAGVSSGCKSDACEDADTAFALEVLLPEAPLRAEVKSLLVSIEAGADRWRRTFDVGDTLADGRTSLAVTLEPTRNEAFPLVLQVDAFAGTGGAGEMLRTARDNFQAAPNGCNAFELTLASTAPGDGGVDAGIDAAVDAGSGGDAEVDGGTPPEDGGPDGGQDGGPDGGEDGGEVDGEVPDAEPGDGGNDDAGVDSGEPPCAVTPDRGTVALYTFEGSMADATGAHPGMRLGNGTAYDLSATGCGTALAFPSSASAQGWASIPDDPAWDLGEASVDLWLRATTGANRSSGVVSRDALGSVSGGHFTLFVACDGTVVAKLEDRGAAVYRCSTSPIPDARWTFVGVTFGPGGFELWVSGQPATRTTPVGLVGVGCSTTIPCGGTSTASLGRNANPWILGASAEGAVEGTGAPLDGPLRNGAIDSFRISDVARTY